MAKQSSPIWSNWSGSVHMTPQEIVMPDSLEALVQVVRNAAHSGRTVRVVGSGHSFTPLVQTDGILVSLDKLQGIISVAEDGQTATIWGGTKLKALGAALLDRGLAQENLGDIDVQSIAGAVSTGTHGTGIRFGTLSTQLAGLTLVTGNGEVLTCSPTQNPDVFKAAQVSLGALGIIAQVTLRVVPAKRLHYTSHGLKLDDCLVHLEEFKQQNTHFEYYWFPYTDLGQVKFMNETEQPVSKSSFWTDFSQNVLENRVFGMLSNMTRRFPRTCETVCAISGMSVPKVDTVNYSHRLFSTPRIVRFQEMEYNIPAEEMPTTIKEMQAHIAKARYRVAFPVECRFVHSDDMWLSPAYQRESAYLAVHMYQGMPYQDYFQGIEQIFRQHNGRPHWGKLHTRTATELATLYPRWDDFQKVRATLDPQGVFLNSYLRTLFGVSSATPATA